MYIKFKGLAMLISLALIAGCAATGQPDFSCSGPTPGISCLPAMDAYELTNDPELYEEVMTELKRLSKLGEKVDPKLVVARIRASRTPKMDVSKAMAAPVRMPLPVLRPAHVIRIWISPWVDQKGDLHMPGLVFSEITPRRWNFGESEVKNTQVLAPVQVDRSQNKK